MLTRGSCQPKMAERDEHINQGDRSLLPTLGVILCLGGTEAFGSFLSCGTQGWCLRRAGGRGGEGVPTTGYFTERKSVKALRSR